MTMVKSIFGAPGQNRVGSACRVTSMSVVTLMAALASQGAAAADEAFAFGGVNWTNQAAFIASGRRCGTVQPDAEAIADIDRQVADALQARGPQAEATGGTINVYVHV